MIPSNYFDIETEGLPEDELFIPEFSAPSNYKDADKISANIAEQKAKWKDRTALSPLSGRILCIGLISDGQFHCLSADGDEKLLLQDFNERVKNSENSPFIGWNIFGFDLPYIQKRCYFHGLKPPIRFDFDAYRTEKWIDLEHLWNNKNKQEHTALNTVAKFLRVGEKCGEGKDFGALWHSNKPAAIEYLKTDCTLLEGIAKKMGVVETGNHPVLAF